MTGEGGEAGAWGGGSLDTWDPGAGDSNGNERGRHGNFLD